MSKLYTKVSECGESYYKCHNCYHVIKESLLVNEKCPCCGSEVSKMCMNDVIEKCTHESTDRLDFCEICGAPICPICGKHDYVIQISRITGYLSNVDGWNAGKREELQDRKKYDI